MTTQAPDGWSVVERPPSLYRRFEFPGYSAARTFLDQLEGLSKETGVYPDLSFSQTYVNVTVQAADGEAVSPEERAYALRAGEMFTPGGA